MKILLLSVLFAISFSREHDGNNFYDMLDGKTPTVKTERAVAREKALGEEKKYYWDMLRGQTPNREKALAEEHNGNNFYNLLDGKTYSDEETALAGFSVRGFFQKLVQSAWGTVVTTFDNAFEATGLDEVVHMVTHGKRLFNQDGSYNNQLAEYAFSKVVKAVETIFDKTGLDNVVHQITGGARAYNPDTGEWDPRIKELLDEGKRIMEAFRNGVDFNFVKKQSEDLVNSIKGSLRSLGSIFQSDMSPDSTGFQILKDVLDGKRSIHDASTKQAIEDYFNKHAMKAIEKIRYRCGLVDTRGSNGERIGTIMVGAGAEVEFIAGASAGVMGAVSIPFSGTETVEFGGYWTVGLDFGLQAGGGASFPICYSWNEKPSGIPGFGLTISTGFSAGPVGFGVDVAWALNTDANEFKLNTVCIQYQPGAKFELAVQASYTGALFDVAKIHLTKPSLEDMGIIKSEQNSIETGWERCASEGENCKCYGSVRFGGRDWSLAIETEKWNVLDRYEGGPKSTGIPCTRERFGEGLTGVSNPYCECQSYVESMGKCGSESDGGWFSSDDTCSCSTGIMRIGKGSRWTQWMSTGTRVRCSYETLGDPAPGVTKECQCGRENQPGFESESSVGKVETEMTFDATSTNTFPMHETIVFFAAIGLAATGVAMYKQLNKGSKYQEVHSEI